MKFKEFMETTSAGGVAAVAMPLGAVQSRTGPKKKKKNTTTKESGLQLKKKKQINTTVIRSNRNEAK